jgi:DNA (cytosine-5)-methyltransferase 1
MPTMVSLFSGAGGLDIGLEEAGFETASATDWDGDCIRTLHANQAQRLPVRGRSGRLHFAGARIVEADLVDVKGSDLFAGNLDLLVGGPPCQPFSSSGKQRSVLEGRGRLFEHFARIAQELRPRIILYENVRGLVTARGRTGRPGEALAEVQAAFEEIGYAVRFGLLNAADFGAPQRRVRLFMVGTRDMALPPFPEPTHGREPRPTLFGRLQPWVSLSEFLVALPSPAPEEIVRPSDRLEPQLRDLPCGCGLKSQGRAEPTRPGGHWGYRQGTFIADLKLPARTVTAAASQDWIRLPDNSLRRLTLRECAGLQGFPMEWRFVGSKASQFRQVGNAVPSVFGRAIGGVLVQALQEASKEHPVSAPLPAGFTAAIQYTQRDHARNAVARQRTNRIIQEALRAGAGR